jgi:drug/metabolite transporter (DMT)-like permease
VLLIVVLALGSALLYGVADFMGGVAARRITVLLATTINYAFAAVLMVVAALVFGGEWTAAAVGGGVIAGVLAVIGLLTFFAALAAGPISLMSPLIALLSSVVPVVATVILGEMLRPLAWVAIALALVASVLIGVERRVPVSRVRPRTVVFAVISGASLGFATVALDSAPQSSALIPVLLDTTVGLALLLALIGAARLSTRVRRFLTVLDTQNPAAASTPPAVAAPPPAATSPAVAAPPVGSTPLGAHAPPAVAHVPHGGAAATATRRARQLAALAGVLFGGANALLMIALHAGNVAVVAVLVNLYPAATVALAWAVLHERVSRTQAAGAVLAIAASVMLGVA